MTWSPTITARTAGLTRSLITAPLACPGDWHIAELPPARRSKAHSRRDSWPTRRERGHELDRRWSRFGVVRVRLVEPRKHGADRERGSAGSERPDRNPVLRHCAVVVQRTTGRAMERHVAALPERSGRVVP